MKSQLIQPVTRPFRSTVRVPGSKSITNRALVLAALASESPSPPKNSPVVSHGGGSKLTGVLFADDTRRMLEALQGLGYQLTIDEPARTVTVAGRMELPQVTTINCGNSGTTIRFLAAMIAALPPLPGRTTPPLILDGIARMRQRPIAQLVDQLCALGTQIRYPDQAGYPPLEITPGGLSSGTCRFQDAASSQYISAILMAAPYARASAPHATVNIELIGPVTSEPYVQMTRRMMHQWSPPHENFMGDDSTPSCLKIKTGRYTPREYAIEPDASNASYFLAAAALNQGSTVTIEGLGKASLQGDVAFADLLHQMGAGLSFGAEFITITGTGEIHGISLDMNAIPDMVQTLAVVALFADSPTHISNVGNLRIKETDRLAALETELTRILKAAYPHDPQAGVTTTNDSITITPPKNPQTPTTVSGTIPITTYDDHRMAMAFAIAGLRIPGIEILDPQCTAKTYPEYFVDLAHALQPPPN